MSDSKLELKLQLLVEATADGKIDWKLLAPSSFGSPLGGGSVTVSLGEVRTLERGAARIETFAAFAVADGQGREVGRLRYADQSHGMGRLAVLHAAASRHINQTDKFIDELLEHLQGP